MFSHSWNIAQKVTVLPLSSSILHFTRSALWHYKCTELIAVQWWYLSMISEQRSGGSWGFKTSFTRLDQRSIHNSVPSVTISSGRCLEKRYTNPARLQWHFFLVHWHLPADNQLVLSQEDTVVLYKQLLRFFASMNVFHLFLHLYSFKLPKSRLSSLMPSTLKLHC